MNRTTKAQRRQLKHDNARYSMRMEEVPRELWPSQTDKYPRVGVWRSRQFLCQAFTAERPAWIRLSINCTELDGKAWKDGITWEELQRIKSECGFGSWSAVEIYPPDDQEVNVANMRHLWILQTPPDYMWGAPA